MTGVNQPQQGVSRNLRPPPTFQDFYEGVNANENPLYLTRGGMALDPLAREAGYDPNLVKGLPVPLGSRIIIWVPNLFYAIGGPPPTLIPYTWGFTWRLRSVRDYNLNAGDRPPYHYTGAQGADDTSGAAAVERSPIPAAYESAVYQQAEPAADTDRALVTVRTADFEFTGGGIAGPLLASGARGVVQQGITDPGVVTNSDQAAWVKHSLLAAGDELLVSIRRETANPNEDWSFADIDQQLAELLGVGNAPNAHPIYKDVGVFVHTGTDP